MSCDVVTILTGFKALEGVGFKRPDIPKDATELAENYARLLRELPAACVAEAFDRYAKSGESTYWPKVGKIRQLTLDVRKEQPAVVSADLRARYFAWENRGWRDETGHLSECPVCDVIPQDVEPEPTFRPSKYPVSKLFRVPHDVQRHLEKRVPALGWPMINPKPAA